MDYYIGELKCPSKACLMKDWSLAWLSCVLLGGAGGEVDGKSRRGWGQGGEVRERVSGVRGRNGGWLQTVVVFFLMCCQS